MYNPKGKNHIPIAGSTRITNEDFIVKIVCAQGVPKADLGSESDPYIFFWLEDSERRARGFVGKTASKDDAKNPWFNCIRNLGTLPREGDALIIEMYDRDSSLVGDDFLGFAVLPASELEYTPKVFPLITPGYKKANCTVTLCIHQWTPPPFEKDIRHVFLIRHGESVWNEAQAAGNVGKMMNYDHPLNKEGIRQAQQLNAAWRAEAAENAKRMPQKRSPVPGERTSIQLSATRSRRSTTDETTTTTTTLTDPSALPKSPLNRVRTASGVSLTGGSSTTRDLPSTPPQRPRIASGPRSSISGPSGPEMAIYRAPTSSGIPITNPNSSSISPTLSAEGFDDKVDLFVNADLIFASPLTRAVETCVIALHGHPHLKDNQVKLLSSCREIKGLGGLDTVGKCVGNETVRRVACLLDEERDTDGEKYHINLDPYDTWSQWWFGPSTSESKKDRMNDFMNTIHYFTPCQKAVIVVAHSFFFRTILQKYLHPDIAAKNPELQKRVIKNASCLYIQIDYSGRLPCVTQVEFMFGGGLLEPEKSK